MEEEIFKIAEQELESDQHFIVNVKIGASPQGKKLTILADGDEGFSIDDCVNLSRKVGLILEEQEMFEKKYVLEVSTPGVGTPLTSLRQYKKNVGRKVKVLLNDSTEYKGELLKVGDTSLDIEHQKTYKEGKKKRKVTEIAKVLIEDINKINVLISL